jgi:hypothetical protein
MKKTQLEARLKEKTLIANGKQIKLDDSLIYAKDSPVSNRVDEIELELRYRKNNDDFIEDEAWRIHQFLEQTGLYDDVQANPYQGEEFSAIVLV